MRIELSVILQIILESLPVSSSGNLALLGLILPTTLNYVTHGATVLIYALFFRKKLYTLAFHPLRCKKIIMHAILYGTAALVPTVVCFVFFNYSEPSFPLRLGFFITTLVLLCTSFDIKENHHLTVARACIIGCAQGAALLPGISRLGITWGVGRFLGLSWRTAFNFSCMIEAPLIIAASLKGIYDMRGQFSTISLWPCLVYAGAIAVSYALLCSAYKLAYYNRWWIFGIYTSMLIIV